MRFSTGGLILAAVVALPATLFSNPAAMTAEPNEKSGPSTAAPDAEPKAPGRGGMGHGWRGGRGEGSVGGMGRGWRGGRGQGPGAADSEFVKDRDLFHLLLSHRADIRRRVDKLANGVRTVTESDDPEVAAAIQQHVDSMARRVETRRPIHLRDPLFAALFAQVDKISMQVERTPKGVRVVETSSDPFVARLIQAHAEVVDLFVANGPAEVRKNHEVPGRKDSGPQAQTSTTSQPK